MGLKNLSIKFFVMGIFFTLLVQPLLNLLIVFYNLPFIGFGSAIILLTLLIRLLLFPLNSKSIKFQKKFKGIQVKMKEIQEKYKKNKELSAQKTLALFREEKVNPFIGFLSLFLQIPIMIALFFLLREGIDLTGLYSFIYNPGVIDTFFLGIDLSNPNLILAGITAATQLIFSKVMQSSGTKVDSKKENLNFMKLLGKNIIYILPFITFFVVLTLPAALAVYWTTNTIASTAQHLYINRIDNK